MAPPVPASRPLSPHALENRFTLFPRLPSELRIMIWKIAIDENGCLLAFNMHQTGSYSYCRFHPRSYESYRQTSPIVLVNHEARAISDSIRGRFIYKPTTNRDHVTGAANGRQDDTRLVFPDPDENLPSSRRIGCVNDMFYLHAKGDISTQLKMTIGGALGNQLERLAISFCASNDVGQYTTEQGLEDAIRGLPRLRQLYLVVDKLFNIDFGPGYVPHFRRKYAHIPDRLPYNRCPDHVTCRTELREHIRSQYDDGFGFSDYDRFTQRWQWPVREPSPTPPRPQIPFRIYNANYRQVVTRVQQISEKLQRRIDVKLKVDLDGIWDAHGNYERSDMNYKGTGLMYWYAKICSSRVSHHRQM